MKVKYIRIFLFVLIVIWALFVFYLSNQTGEESSGVSRMIARIFTKDENMLDIVERYIRKLAHFSEYALGGILFLLLFYTYKWSDRKTMTISISLGMWYAITDEIHQLLVSQRNGSIIDVYIDTLGVATGVCTIFLIIKIIENFKNKKKIKAQ